MTETNYVDPERTPQLMVSDQVLQSKVTETESTTGSFLLVYRS